MTESDPAPNDAGNRSVRRPGGSTVHARRVGPDDLQALAALYAGLIEAELHRRFLGLGQPDMAFVERVATIEERGGFGMVVVATEPTDPIGRVVAEAGYEPRADGDGELAMTVAAGQPGWIGRFLLQALREAAATRGVVNLRGLVQSSDTRMLVLARSLGAVFAPSTDSRTVRFVVATRGALPRWPPLHDRPRVLIEAAAGHWRGEAAATRAGLQVLVCPGPQQRRCPSVNGRTCPLAAAADAIVITQPPRDARWDTLLDRHRPLHPGVPICMDQPRARGIEPRGALRLPADDRAAVRAVQRVAEQHARRTDGWLDLSGHR